ncbi:holo-[acyl-carrier-protein] synthase [Frondihabitans sp. PhB188]|uniref:acyl carrier protein n=1 Tax=Frondihabitans sp. PhB188 TaxID=2485200 RepID=UPI000FB35946|nr:acyl carrier protein [Frondihabitans sp. PhB188]ROQ40127.1 holo-[acyl-carrier-protein] synthase [Frondihabitans sp. PhB188]
MRELTGTRMPRPRVGTDLVTVADVRDSVTRFGASYLNRVFTPIELDQTQGDVERLAARFAGKEAVVKVLRPSRDQGLPYRDVEIANAPSGAPRVRLHGLARLEATGSGIHSIAIALTHDHGVAQATAFALLTRKDPFDMKATIRTVLDQHGHLVTPVAELGDGDDLYQAGLSSHATVNVMLALEEELDLEFPDELLSRATFSSIDSLEAAASALGVDA